MFRRFGSGVPHEIVILKCPQIRLRRRLIEQEIDRSLKIAVALGFLLCAAFCAVGAAVIGFHALLGLWWAAFAIVALISGAAGLGFFLLARRRSAVS